MINCSPGTVGGIMDYLRILKVPIHPNVLILVGVSTLLLTVCLWGAMHSAAWFAGVMGAGFVQLWVFKYCYVLIEQMADGAPEPPVMDIDMLSPFEIRPWIQMALLAGGGWFCVYLGDAAGLLLAAVLVLWTPASIAILGVGESPWEVFNPRMLYRLVRGLGVHYFVLLFAMGLGVVLAVALWRSGMILALRIALLVWFEIAFFALIAGLLHARRRQIGYEPSRSPERKAAREEAERQQLRARMMDDVFAQVRIGKNVDATAPLAGWLRDLDADYAARDAAFVVDQALLWKRPAALDTLGSTLIRHLLRFGRADAALEIFERLREQSAEFTMDSAADLRTLAEYADSVGRDELAASMRLETPIYHPPPT